MYMLQNYNVFPRPLPICLPSGTAREPFVSEWEGKGGWEVFQETNFGCHLILPF